MEKGSRIARVELSDGVCRFRMDAYLLGDPDDERLMLSVDVVTPGGSWRSRAASVVAPSFASVASAASETDEGSLTTGAVDYADEKSGACLAFSFRLLADGRVEVAVVIDEGLRPDIPVHPRDRADEVLLRVREDEVLAFATALETLALRDPAHFAWTG